MAVARLPATTPGAPRAARGRAAPAHLARLAERRARRARRHAPSWSPPRRTPVPRRRLRAPRDRRPPSSRAATTPPTAAVWRPRGPRAHGVRLQPHRAARRHRDRRRHPHRRVGLVLVAYRLVRELERAARRGLVAGLRPAPHQRRARRVPGAPRRPRCRCSASGIAFAVPSDDGPETVTYFYDAGRRVLWRKAPSAHLAEGVDDFTISYLDAQGRALAPAPGGVLPDADLPLVRRVAFWARVRCASQTEQASWQVCLPASSMRSPAFWALCLRGGPGPARAPGGGQPRAGARRRRLPSGRPGLRAGAHPRPLGGERGFALLAALLIASIALLATASLVAAALSSASISADDALAGAGRRRSPAPAWPTPSSVCAGAGCPRPRRRCRRASGRLRRRRHLHGDGGGAFGRRPRAASRRRLRRSRPPTRRGRLPHRSDGRRGDTARRTVHVIALSTPDALPRGLVVGGRRRPSRRRARCTGLRPVRRRRRRRPRVGHLSAGGSPSARRPRPRLRRAVSAAGVHAAGHIVAGGAEEHASARRAGRPTPTPTPASRRRPTSWRRPAPPRWPLSRRTRPTPAPRFDASALDLALLDTAARRRRSARPRWPPAAASTCSTPERRGARSVGRAARAAPGLPAHRRRAGRLHRRRSRRRGRRAERRAGGHRHPHCRRAAARRRAACMPAPGRATRRSRSPAFHGRRGRPGRRQRARRVSWRNEPRPPGGAGSPRALARAGSTASPAGAATLT